MQRNFNTAKSSERNLETHKSEIESNKRLKMSARPLVRRHKLAISSSYLFSILLFIQLVAANSDSNISGEPNPEIPKQAAASRVHLAGELESRNSVPEIGKLGSSLVVQT